MTTANAIRSLRETLERLGKEATPGNLSTAEVKECLDVGNCPLCDGDGTAPYGVDTFTNFDGVAVGVQFFGVGNEHGAHQKLWEAYVNNHAQILSALRVAEVVPEIEKALREMTSGFVIANGNLTDGHIEQVSREDVLKEFSRRQGVASNALAALQSAKEPTP